MTVGEPDDAKKRWEVYEKRQGRKATFDEVGDVVVLLSTPRMSLVVGHNLVIDGYVLCADARRLLTPCLGDSQSMRQPNDSFELWRLVNHGQVDDLKTLCRRVRLWKVCSTFEDRNIVLLQKVSVCIHFVKQ